MLLDKLKSMLQELPPTMAVEISEAGIASARIGARAELEFAPLPAGARWFDDEIEVGVSAC